MKLFAELLDSLIFMPSRNGKLRLLEDYFRAAPDPDRGYGLAALTGGLDLPHAKPAMIRDLAMSRIDPELFALSYDYVGDLAETVALIWPARAGANRPPDIATVVETLADAGRDAVPGLVEGWLDACESEGRFALLKLITGGFRVGVSARLAKTALARFGDRPVEEIEELWHGLTPPYSGLFAWLEGRGGPPRIDGSAAFRPLMLANPLDEADLARLDPADFLAEWKWDGIRVQVVADGEVRRIYSRTGDEVSRSFPDLAAALDFDAVLDGELLVVRNGKVAPFADLQKRLGRKTVGRKLLEEAPAHIRLYDILFAAGEDLRSLPLEDRRARLEAWYGKTAPARMDLSPLIPFNDWSELAEKRQGARTASIEGLMLKRRDSRYVAGRPKGPWFKWKRDPLTVDCVLMYAQRGHGKRSSYYSDYTFGCWRDGADGTHELVPVGKAYFGFTDAELAHLDRYVRNHTVERFGPVRAVEAGLVLEIAFDAVQRSTRHKSGVAMRFPRVHRIRWDKPAAEADRIETLESFLD